MKNDLKILLDSKAKLNAIKNEILKNLNEFEKLNNILINFEVVEPANNLTLSNITQDIDLNKINSFNDKIHVNQTFCNFSKLRKIKLERNRKKTNFYKINSLSNYSNITDDYKNKSEHDIENSINDSKRINNTINVVDLNKNNKISKTISNVNNKTDTEKDLSLINKTDNSNNSITSDDLLDLIADQTESIKNEICSNCLEINNALNILIDEIKNIKSQLKKFSADKLPKKEAYEKLSYCINNINLIKADLFKLNEILDTLQKANCSNFVNNSKKYTLVVNSTNKLVEIIQNVMRKLNIKINLVVLN